VNEDQIFYVDEFYDKVIQDIHSHSYSKQEKFQVVYKAVNKLMTMTTTINDSQVLTNGLVYLLGFLNNQPLDGFKDTKPQLGNNKEKYKSILKEEFNSH
jgi:hypothetical protein